MHHVCFSAPFFARARWVAGRAYARANPPRPAPLAWPQDAPELVRQHGAVAAHGDAVQGRVRAHEPAERVGARPPHHRLPVVQPRLVQVLRAHGGVERHAPAAPAPRLVRLGAVVDGEVFRRCPDLEVARVRALDALHDLHGQLARQQRVLAVRLHQTRRIQTWCVTQNGHVFFTRHRDGCAGADDARSGASSPASEPGNPPVVAWGFVRWTDLGRPSPPRVPGNVDHRRPAREVPVAHGQRGRRGSGGGGASARRGVLKQMTTIEMGRAHAAWA